MAWMWVLLNFAGCMKTIKAVKLNHWVNQLDLFSKQDCKYYVIQYWVVLDLGAFALFQVLLLYYDTDVGIIYFTLSKFEDRMQEWNVRN